jgi:hypothetical protein
MNANIGFTARAMGSLLVAAAVASTVLAAPHQAVPRGGGGGARPSAPTHHSGTAYRPSAPAGHAPMAHRTASGTARYGYGGYGGYGYGYGHGGYGYGGYYPYWGGWWYPWWGVGWYGGWWDAYWPGYTYAPYQSGYDDTYVADTGSSYNSHKNEPAVVETKVSPASAAVSLDGDAVGYASDYNGRWDRLRVAPGRHSIAFRAKGYRSLTIDLEARPGATYVLSDALVAGEGDDSRTLASPAAPPALAAPPAQAANDSMTRPPATGRLRVHAEPGDAAVYLDGEYLGLGAELARIHGALAVPTGTHRLEAARPGFASAVRTIEVGDRDVAQIDIVLESER